MALVTYVSSGSHSSADTISYATSGTETDLAGYGLSGFEFTLNQNINLTQLGFTALDLGGGDTPHVTLWNATAGLGSLSQIYDTGNILSSVTSHTDSTQSGTPSFVSVGTPILLTAGQTYLVTAPAYWVSTFNTSGITPNSVFASSSILQGGGWTGWANSGYSFTSLTAAPSGQIPTTANFQFTTVVVPEPSTYAMFGASCLVLLAVLRRRHVGSSTL